VEISSALAADLRTLTDALDPPRVDLADQLLRLITSIRMKPESYLGLALTVVNAGVPLTVTAFVDAVTTAHVRSSAQLPLSRLCDAEPGSAIVFYASEPVAFVDFAVELSAALDLATGVITLDGHLNPPEWMGADTAMDPASQMNQALGILIDRGFVPEDARAELEGLAVRRAAGRTAAAVHVINGVARGSRGRSVARRI
jgi:hypothetical protein